MQKIRHSKIWFPKKVFGFQYELKSNSKVWHIFDDAVEYENNKYVDRNRNNKYVDRNYQQPKVDFGGDLQLLIKPFTTIKIQLFWAKRNYEVTD